MKKLTFMNALLVALTISLFGSVHSYAEERELDPEDPTQCFLGCSYGSPSQEVDDYCANICACAARPDETIDSCRDKDKNGDGNPDRVAPEPDKDFYIKYFQNLNFSPDTIKK